MMRVSVVAQGLPQRVTEGNVRKDVARNIVLEHPVAFALLTGVVVVATSVGAGLLLIQAHGGGWPWWFHGITYSVCNSWLRDRNRAKNQEQIIAEVNHHINNALTVIRGRKLLPETESDRIIEAEIKRISWAIKEILPNVREGTVQYISDFPKYLKSSSRIPAKISTMFCWRRLQTDPVRCRWKSSRRRR
jgi:signal transduction histidine kinase